VNTESVREFSRIICTFAHRSNAMYKANVNGQSFEVLRDDQTFSVNGEEFKWDLQKIHEGYFHIIYNNRSYTAVKADRSAKTFHIKINGTVYPVILKDRFDLLLEQMGMNATGSGKVNNIKAPMPGLILELKVKDGDTVKQGDVLLILEAMKMENIIKSPGDGIVKTVKVKKGDSVEKNQVLIEF
jgi:biotin carboxyl carrier protein